MGRVRGGTEVRRMRLGREVNWRMGAVAARNMRRCGFVFICTVPEQTFEWLCHAFFQQIMKVGLS